MPIETFVAHSPGSAVSVEVEMDMGVFAGIVSDAETAQREAARAIIDGWITEVTADMKQSASWQDRTGNARKTLGVLEELRGDVVELVMTGGVFYMKYLELFFKDAIGNPRFAILKPSFDKWMPVLIERLGAEIE